jgi:hypothetical protein
MLIVTVSIRKRQAVLSMPHLPSNHVGVGQCKKSPPSTQYTALRVYAPLLYYEALMSLDPGSVNRPRRNHHFERLIDFFSHALRYCSLSNYTKSSGYVKIRPLRIHGAKFHLRGICHMNTVRYTVPTRSKIPLGHSNLPTFQLTPSRSS